MIHYIVSITVTILFYGCVTYMSFFTAAILHRGILYKLPITIIRAVVFIALCYISIISDVIMFQASMYETIATKNGFLLLLVTASLINARRKGD